MRQVMMTGLVLGCAVVGGCAGSREAKVDAQAPREASRRRPPALMIETRHGLPADGAAATETFAFEAQGSEVYTPKQTRVVKRVAEEPLSTFAVDVDTASYSIVRRMLREGRWPDKDAVRVEEFVNYFDYGYEAPRDATPFAVSSELVESPFGARGKHLLRVGVQGRVVEAEERKAMHLVFLVDVSGSMQSPDKLGLVKASLRMLLGNLRMGDTVALCTYAGRVAQVLGPTGMERKGAIHEAIEALEAGGSTAMASGLELAYRCASETLRPGEVSRVIVCSDGDANVGSTSFEEILEEVSEYRERGVTLSTIGFGMGNYKDVMMEQLANKGDGNYFYIDDREQAKRVFLDEVLGTLQVIAKDVKVQVEFGPGVESYRLVGYENRDLANEDFRRDEVDAGEIGAGHSVTAIYEVTLSQGGGPVGVVRLRAKPPEGDVAEEWLTPLAAEAGSFSSAPPAFKVCAAVMGLAEVLRGSPHAEGWSLETVEAAAKAGRLRRDEDRRELLTLIARAWELQRSQS